MKRSPLRRKSALARRSRIAQVRAKARRSSRVRDEAYLAWVRQQPCRVGAAGVPGCLGPIDPDHKRAGVGAGTKASDRDAWPVCRKHHDDRHAMRGPFTFMTKEQLRAFIDARIAEANAAYERHLAASGAA